MSITTNFNTSGYTKVLAQVSQENPLTKASYEVWEDLDSATSVEKTQSSVSLVSKEAFQQSNKRPLHPLAEFPESKSIRLASSESSVENEDEEPLWTQEQIDVVLKEIDRRKVAPWDPVGLDELAQRVGGLSRQECVAMYHHIASNEQVFRSLKSMLDLIDQKQALVQNDTALDRYLETGELYPVTSNGSSDSATGLFNE